MDKSRPFYTRLWFLILFFFIILITASWIFLQYLFPTTSPINTVSYFIYSKQHPHVLLRKQTIAFLPYWRLSDNAYTRFDLLSEINYFSLTVTKDGNFQTIVNNETDPGWLQWQSQQVKDLIAKTQITGSAFTLTIASQRNKTIESLLAKPKAQQMLIANILNQVTTRHLNGIILDFEYDGNPDEKYQKAFTTFAKNLHQTLSEKAPGTTLSITLLPLAAREKDLYDFKSLAPVIDRFIGMSYDYYAQSSDIAGPVAPLTGFSENKFFFDVTTTYQDYLRVIPKGKLIMGIPYYGYDWAVKDGKKIQSPTLPADDPNNYAAVISYGRMRVDKDLKNNQCQWDDYAKEKWCWYIDKKGVDHQVWFEDNESIQKKYDYAKQNDLAGIAIWTLGYDKGYPDLWNVMMQSFRQ